MIDETGQSIFMKKTIPISSISVETCGYINELHSCLLGDS